MFEGQTHLGTQDIGSFRMLLFFFNSCSNAHNCVCARCCVLQADSNQVKQSWLDALQGSIDLAYRVNLTQAGLHSHVNT